MSPLDPIFWCHHNMIECLWVDWNIDMGNSEHERSGLGQFELPNDFVDGDGNPAPIQVATTLLFPMLSYQYEPCAPGDGESGRGERQGNVGEIPARRRAAQA